VERKRSLAAAYEEGAQLMEQVHAGDQLASTADDMAQRLPSGPVTMLSTTIEGAAIAAVCAAQRPAASWRMIELSWQPAIITDTPVVFVEPVEPGAAWRDAVERRYPEATVLIATVSTDTLLRAA
jgi:hypothetical protein